MKYIIREMEVKYKNFKKVKSVKFISPENIYSWFKNLQNEGVEKFLTIYLNGQNEVISFSADFSGGVASCFFDLSRILKQALLQEAPSIVVVHNHPSGDIEPSGADIEHTKDLKAGCKAVGIKLLDHIIIGLNKYTSFEDRGIL